MLILPVLAPKQSTATIPLLEISTAGSSEIVTVSDDVHPGYIRFKLFESE